VPEEYVYKIVIDDSEVSTALDKIDRQVVLLAEKMDGMFRGVGAGAGAGLQQAAQQVEQTSQRMTRAQAQTAQETQRSQQQTAQVAETSARRTGQAAIQSARVQVQNSREVVRAREQERQSLERAASAAQSQAQVAQQTAETKKRAWEDAKTAVVNAAAAQAQAEEELANVSREAGEAEKETLQRRVEDRKAEVQAAKEDVRTKKESHVEAARAAKDASAVEREANRAARQGSRQVTRAKQAQGRAERALGKETRNAAKQTRANAKEQRQAERLFIRTSKTFGKQRKQLDELAKKYGSFSVTVGKSSDELDEHEKEVYDVIRSDRQLAQEIDKLTAKYSKFNVAVDRATFRGGPQIGIPRTQFRQAGFAIGRAGVPGAATIGEAAAVGGVAGVAAISVLLTVNQLIDAFKTLANIAVDTFKKIISGSVEAAKEIEVARAQFTAFFEQDAIAAEAALQRLQALSIELGENVVGIGRAFLPEVESLDQLEEVVKIATALARFQPEQGILGARIALQEALAGEFRSLQRRFEISPVAIDKIRNAMEAGGVTAGLEAIQAELERTGRSVEDLADTFSVSMGRIRERFRQLGQDLGAPIIEEVADQFDAIDEQLEELEPDLSVIADAFGEIFARLSEIIGIYITDFLADFDPAPLLDVADAAHRVVNAFGLILDVLGGGTGAANTFGTAIDGIAGNLITLEGWLLKIGSRLSEFRNNFKAQALDFYRELESLLQINAILQQAGFGFAPAEAVGADPASFLEHVREQIELIEELGDTIEPFDWDAAIAQNEIANQDFRDSLTDSINAMDDADTQGEILANRFLKIAQSLEQLDSIQQQYAESQEKVNEAIEEFNIQAALKFEKLLTDARRARLDFEIQAAQKALDLERKNAQKIADIHTKYHQDILDAAQDLTDREADIMRKYGDNVVDLENDRNKKRLEAEEKYLDDLQKLRDKFNFQAFEAMLANDAKQLRQIRRRQAFEESQLGKDRDRDLRDIDQDVETRREKLDLALEREIRDARIANARKLRDLQQNLQQQLDKQEEARRRDLEQQAIAEKRKRDELNNALREQLQDYDTWWQERYRVTAEGIAADLEAMQGYVDQANSILGGLGALGVGFDPITGEAILLQRPPTITSTESPEVAALRETLIDAQLWFENLSRRAGDPLPRREDIAEQFAELNVTELIEVMREFAEQFPDRFGIEDFLGEEKRILREQAIFLGAQVGFTEEEILGELPLSLSHLREWVDEFVAAYSPRELPPFSLFGQMEQVAEGLPAAPSQEYLAAFGIAPEEVLNMMVPMQERLIALWAEQLAPAPEFTAEQWLMGIERLAESLSVNGLINALEAAQETAGLIAGEPGAISTADIRALLLQDAQPAEWQAQLFPGLFGAGIVPGAIPGAIPSIEPGAVLGAPPAGITGPDLLRFAQAVPGQTPFIFPGVTQAPYVVPEDADFLPDFGQLMMAFGGQIPPAGVFEGLFQPQAFIPGGPQFAFDADTYQAMLDEQIGAQVLAELQKRGEIEDTVAFAELMAEKEALATAALLGDQTYQYQVASDEQIAILEETLARQQETLATLAADPAMEEEARTVEQAIGIIETALAAMQEERAAANAQLALEETAAVESAEQDKIDAVAGTTTAVLQEVDERGLAQVRALDRETDSVQDAADEQVDIIAQQETDKAITRDESRAMELEANLEHSETRREQEAEGFENELKLLSKHFANFLKHEEQWMEYDLRLLQWWLLQRQQLINQAIGQLPGLPGDGGPDLPGGGGDGGGTASLEELQSLAISLAEQLGILDQDTRNEILTLPYDDLIDFIEWLQSQLPGYALGGGFGPGLAVVGERGEPEIVRMGGAGRVDVFKDLLFRSTPPVSAGGTTHNDNSMNMGGFNIPAPFDLSQAQIRIVQNMISTAVREAWASRL
jgi:hypothetical protein